MNGLAAARRRETAVIRERHARRPPETTANAVIEGDVVDVLRSLPADAKFDVIIADPPYNIGKDFGNNQDAMPLAAYVGWTQEWIAACFERLASDGVRQLPANPLLTNAVA